jgi:plasmid stability protein
VSQSASNVLSFCDMKTLYLRNVPDEVGQRLEKLAARQGLSVSAFAVQALSEVARRADNPALLAALPDLGVAADEVVRDIETGRPAH